MNYSTGKFWQPDVTVATVVVRNGRVLIVEELVHGEKVLNQPAGHLEPAETLVEAAVRETLEETGWTVRLTAFIGAYQWQAPIRPDGTGGRYYLRMAFAADVITHDPDRTLDEGIVQAVWLTPEQLSEQFARHRSPLVWRVVEDYLGGKRYPLDAMTQLT